MRCIWRKTLIPQGRMVHGSEAFSYQFKSYSTQQNQSSTLVKSRWQHVRLAAQELAIISRNTCYFLFTLSFLPLPSGSSSPFRSAIISSSSLLRAAQIWRFAISSNLFIAFSIPDMTVTFDQTFSYSHLSEPPYDGAYSCSPPEPRGAPESSKREQSQSQEC